MRASGIGIPRPVISSLKGEVMARMALIALTAIACLCFVFHVCNGRTFTHSTAEALCPGSGVVIEADIADNTTSCGKSRSTALYS